MTKYLEVNNLSYSYPDGHEALKDISFDLDNKESLAILGPNGAGKTTLILHLNGILGNLDKEIKVSNFEYTDENIADIRKTVGVVFQDPDDQLFMPTVLEDVMFGPKNFGYTNEEAEKNVLRVNEEFHNLMENRKKNAEERIRQIKNQAEKDIKNASVKIAIESVEKLIKNSLDKSKLDKIYSSSVEETKLALKKKSS